MKQYLSLLILIFFSFNLSAQQVIWERVDQRSLIGYTFLDVVHLPDSTFYFTTLGGLGSGNGYPVFFTKYNAAGTLQWHSAGRIMRTGEQGSIVESDSIVVFTGTPPVPVNSMRALFQRINTKTGDTLPGIILHTPNFINFIPTSIISDNDKGYTVAGYPAVSFQKYNDYSLIKTDSLGNVLWYRNYGGSNLEYSSSLIRNTRGNYIISGISASFNTQPNMTGYHPFIIEIKPNGDSINSKTFLLKYPQYKELNNRFVNNFIETTDGGYIFSGNIDSTVSANQTYYLNFLVKLDAQLNVQWTYIDRTFAPSRLIAGKVKELANSSYAFYLSYYSSPVATPSQFAVVKVSATGQYQSHQIYQSNLNCDKLLLYDWEVLNDGTAVVCGRCKSNEAYVARISGVGAPAVVGTAKALIKETPAIEAYPNPARDIVQLSYQLPSGTAKAEVLLYELVTGREVKRVNLNRAATQEVISLAGFANGLYAFTLLVDGVPVITKKLVVVK